MDAINSEVSVDRLNGSITAAILASARLHIHFGNGTGARDPFWSTKCEEAIKSRDRALAAATRLGHTQDDVEA